MHEGHPEIEAVEVDCDIRCDVRKLYRQYSALVVYSLLQCGGTRDGDRLGLCIFGYVRNCQNGHVAFIVDTVVERESFHIAGKADLVVLLDYLASRRVLFPDGHVHAGDVDLAVIHADLALGHVSLLDHRTRDVGLVHVAVNGKGDLQVDRAVSARNGKNVNS